MGALGVVPASRVAMDTSSLLIAFGPPLTFKAPAPKPIISNEFKGSFSTTWVVYSTVVPLALSTYQLVKNVPLMDMNGDKGLKLSTFHFGQFLCRNFDQLIQHVHEKLISFFHDLP